jgi:FeS assembly protein SufD
MKVAFQHANVLPGRTWNRLGINDTEFRAEAARAVPYGDKAVSLPAGVTLSAEPFPAEIETGMGKEAADFVEKNRNCGVSLRVAAGAKPERPVFLPYELDGARSAVVDENAVVAGEGSEVTVVMSYRSRADLAGFHGGLTRLYAAKGAVIHLIQVQLLGDRCAHFDNVGAFAEENGKIDVIQAELGGRRALSGVKTRLDGRKSRLNMDAIYFGDRKRSIDFNYVAEHTGKKTASEIHVSGALLDESEKTFRGTIDFVRGAKQAVGHESEYNLLFSPRVRNRTAPLILCSEEDVDGQHAASTGKIDADRLFYLMSRGLSELEAKKLIIEAQFRPVTDRIPDEKLRAAILEYVKVRLNGLESLG